MSLTTVGERLGDIFIASFLKCLSGLSRHDHKSIN